MMTKIALHTEDENEKQKRFKNKNTYFVNSKTNERN